MCVCVNNGACSWIYLYIFKRNYCYWVGYKKIRITLIYKFTALVDQKALRTHAVQNGIYSIHTQINGSLFSWPGVKGQTDCGVMCGSNEGNCEWKGLHPDNKSGQAILRSDWGLYTAKNVRKARVIVGEVIRNAMRWTFTFPLYTRWKNKCTLHPTFTNCGNAPHSRSSVNQAPSTKILNP
jgi:hypothetical protein